MRQQYDTTKQIAGKYSKPEKPVKDKEGRPITEIQEQRNGWDIVAAHTDLPIDVIRTTAEETRMAIRQIKYEKAARPDNIPAKALKTDTEVTANMLQLLFKKVWEKEQVSMDWKEGYFIKILKKGYLRKYENYRDIAPLSVPRKVFNKVLPNWMKDAVDA
ncbi:unnamed protein product [Schistosoma curassoni]|uniref:Transposase n=1 Tax=Schistosoma curassoni TaxID=6186 RepID=A0A183JUZ1_9TREM|nr:unnamed protein product [Schistosoma curassoni]